MFFSFLKRINTDDDVDDDLTVSLLSSRWSNRVIPQLLMMMMMMMMLIMRGKIEISIELFPSLDLHNSNRLLHGNKK